MKEGDLSKRYHYSLLEFCSELLLLLLDSDSASASESFAAAAAAVVYSADSLAAGKQ